MELVLSIIAIVISVIAMCSEFFGSQRISRINLEAHFFEEIYNDYLLDKLPSARNKVTYNNNIVTGTEELIDVLNEIRRKSIFFKYRDIKFYNNICTHLQSFEDELVKKSDMHLEDEHYCRFTQYVNDSMEEIYDIIITKYTGKLKKHKKRKK
ncbi:MAG: hypothetical protein V8R99_00565 [Eubacterium ventriosum]|uniref:hypothetical protein n=1 Tax=Eubacterium ventriosum TaxID=39496 RepID=UPI00300F71E9